MAKSDTYVALSNREIQMLMRMFEDYRPRLQNDNIYIDDLKNKIADAKAFQDHMKGFDK